MMAFVKYDQHALTVNRCRVSIWISGDLGIGGANAADIEAQLSIFQNAISAPCQHDAKIFGLINPVLAQRPRWGYDMDSIDSPVGYQVKRQRDRQFGFAAAGGGNYKKVLAAPKCYPREIAAVCLPGP